MIDETWFYPIKWKLPCLYFDEWKDETDNLFHEFSGVLFTHEAPTENADIFEFINRVKTS
ncbi:hypothetical protein GCM10023313_01380 [Mucilaginibacter defluvii]|uniref:Uncharacterized protein n=1 Tax=Mucilaginibacter defluvii TaxID=1196019 RepID=A0ABP9FHV6_9SPHI